MTAEGPRANASADGHELLPSPPHASARRNDARGLLRAAWNWHEQPWLVAWAATPAGRIAVGLLTAALVPWQTSVLIVPALALFAFFPKRRIEILAVGSIVVLAQRFAPDFRLVGIAGTVTTMLAQAALLYLVYRAAREYDRLPNAIRRAPQVWLHATMLGLAAVLAVTRVHLGAAPREGPWLLATGTVMFVPFLLWRAAYIVQAGMRGTARTSGFADHLFYALPVWGGTAVPYGKGYDYLRQCRAEDTEPIAASQLAGIKLLLLALVWQKAGALAMVVIHGQRAPDYVRALDDLSLRWPTLGAMIASGAAATPLAVRWGSVAIELIENTLQIAVMGHVIIGLLRLFGFRAYRNTYKPLLAPSIVEFWNRYYYYFKELLVEFFFLPAYLRWFKRRPRLRIFTAVMVSLLVGNVYFHLIRDFSEYTRHGVIDAVSLLASRAFYCLLLGLGIFVSMVRERERRGRPAPSGRRSNVTVVRRIVGVWVFYGLIHIWNVGPIDLTFRQRTTFFLGLFGLE